MGAYRHDNGRFAKGNRGGPGRPRRVVEANYLAALFDAVPLDTWERICDQAVAQALRGDHRAREWLSNYLIGRPLQAVELNRPDGEPVTLSMFLAVINEFIHDDDTRYAIADKFYQLSSDDLVDAKGLTSSASSGR
jgi:hypothetical protein